MKIESRKEHPHERKDSSVKKTESTLQRFLSGKQTKETKPSAGAFEKILAETRKQNNKPEELQANLKKSAETELQTDETNDRVELALTGKDETEEQTKHEDAGGEQLGDGDGQNLSSAPLLSSNLKSAPENPVAAARSILHVADLERIVATIRTETFQNSKQVKIALKNSVLQGLEIKLTIDQNGKLKAEFLAQNEQIKKQLDARKRELKEIFVRRAVNFAQIEVIEKE
ncbi:MAG TPA: hypothetical protein PKY59_02390 [Pyrinomonadaceae bacterium]|nr:hypothetical protein [Pyrinomonadaceae bacterium]